MNCPYCGKTMLHGKLLGDQHQLRWLPDNKKMLFGLCWSQGNGERRRRQSVLL